MQKILIVEDDADIAAIERDYLELNGYQVETAPDGDSGLERGLSGGFDLILLDMQMPVMDGCEAARQIRAMDRPDAAAVPIIAVTANAFSEDVSATTAAGMNAHISKPIDLAALQQTLERLIRPL